MFQVLKFFTLFSLIFSTNSVWGQANIEAQASSTAKSDGLKVMHSLGFSGRIGANQTPGEASPATAGIDYTAVVLPAKNISMILRAGFVNELDYGPDGKQEASLNNTLLITNFNNIYENEFGKLNLNTFTTLPTNPDSWKFESFRGGIQFGPNWVFKTPANFFLRFRTNLSRRFHEFKTHINGSNNTETILSHQLFFSYAFNSTFSFSNIFSNFHVWNTSGNRTQDFFYMGQIFDININRNFTLSLGHDLQDSTFSYNGQTYNLSVYDLDQSMFYAYLTYRL